MPMLIKGKKGSLRTAKKTRKAKSYTDETQQTQKTVSKFFRDAVEKVKRSSRTPTVSIKPQKQTLKTKTNISQELDERIQRRAFALYEQRGRLEGYEEFDWKIAGKIVCLEIEKEVGFTKNRRKRSSEEISQKTERKAYDLFIQSGSRSGNDAFNWVLAEEIVRLENE